MQYELSVIKTLLSHEQWLRYRDKVQTSLFPRELQHLYSALDNFHQNHAVDLTVADLANLVLAQQRDPEYYKAVLGNLETLSVSDTTTEVLLQALYEHKLLKDISLTAYELTEGRGSKEEFQKLVERYQEGAPKPTNDFEFVTDDVESLLNDTFRKPGLRWRLQTLNRMFGSLRGGDFGFIFARPETGKTTFLSSETTFMAEQLTEDMGPVIWFNNEEENKKVRLRAIQGCLGITTAQLNANPQAARNEFLQRTKGKHLLLSNEGSISKTVVEQVVERYKPSLVVIDQIDKITGFDADREDLKLGAIYQWKRELGKQYNHATIAVCQADGSGEGVRWLTMNNVSSAKTSKQAEADWILGIGKIHDTGFENVRFLHASKNKLTGDEDTEESLRHGRMEVLINPTIARYEDIT